MQHHCPFTPPTGTLIKGTTIQNDPRSAHKRRPTAEASKKRKRIHGSGRMMQFLRC
jgi:hypothetical protein